MAVLVVGCGRGAGGEPPEDAGEVEASSLTIMGLVAAPNPGNVLSYFVVWSTDRPASSVVDVDCGDYEAVVSSEELRNEHEVLVLGLYDGAECDIEVGGVAADGAAGSESVSVHVGPLPEVVPELDLVVADDERVQPGWTAFNLSNTVEEVPPIIAVVDAQGRYRWYHVRATEASGSAMVVRLVPEGFLVGGGSDGGNTWPAIIDLAGQVVWEGSLGAEHHEILPWGDDDELMYLSMTKDCPDGIGESATIEIHDRGTGETTWEWALCEHFTPKSGKKDWDHSNSIDPFPDGDALLLSVRNLSRVFKVDLETEEILWTLGKDGDFARTDAGKGAAFLRQHAAELIGDDRVILFDNGETGVREKSGAVELAFDEEAMEYEVAWSWYPEPPIFCKVWGDADRLENGNTLITFGRREELDSHLIEVSPEGDRVWELVTPPGWGCYRAERIDGLPAGVVE